MEPERIALSQRERDRLKVLHEVQQKHLTQVEAAARLNVTDRQVAFASAEINELGCALPASDSPGRQIPDKLKFQANALAKGYSAGFPHAPHTHLLFHSWRSFHHASRDRAAIRRNLPAGSLSDVFRILSDAVFLSEIPRMDSVEVCGQPHL
jgi:hypothetical protein